MSERTLVVSDLHLGAAGPRDILLHDQHAREQFLRAIATADRLVLLGDTLELKEGRDKWTTNAAWPFVAQIARAFAGDEILLVIGNHDSTLASDFLQTIDKDNFTSEHILTPKPGTNLYHLQMILGPRAKVFYPGVWIDDVWLTHGHYADKPVLDGMTLWDVEMETRESPFSKTLHAYLPLISTPPPIKRRARPYALGLLEPRHIQSATAHMPAIVSLLPQQPQHVIYGHIHRGGLLHQTDSVQIWNTGCWTNDEALLRSESPYYRPGGVIWLEDGQPQYENILDR